MKAKLLPRIVVFLALVGLAALAYALWWLPRHPTNSTDATPPPVTDRYQVAQVRKGQMIGAVGATGAVRSRQSAVLVWQTSGTVSRVTVTAGQVVQQGAELARLEQTSLPQAVILAQAELVNAQKALDNLLQSTQARAAAQMALVKAQKALDDAQDNRTNKLYQRASQETIDIARARLITANEALDQAEAFFDTHSGNPESLTYATALDQLAKARQNQLHAQWNLNYVQGLPDPLDIEEADAAIAVAEANVLQARLDWERVKDGPNDQDIAAAEARVTAAQATLNLARIAAPFEGTLVLVNSKVGDQVLAGMTAFQIDDLSHLYVEVTVAEKEIAQVAPGQQVRLWLEALPGREYTGAVTEVGLVGKTTAGTVNYIVTIEITNPGPEIRPGMTASVEIIVSQIQDALLVPASAVRIQGGQRVVYLLKDGVPLPVAVTVAAGTVAGHETAVLGGIQEGDMVIVNPSAVR